MSLLRTAKFLAFVAVILLVLSLIVGSILGQPVLFGYVETGSMSPTLEPGDGFVAIPARLSGPIQGGDVIVYEASEVQGGGLTTHRVVNEMEYGYITRGDANPFSDQDGDEPPVKRAQVVAVAWQPGGSVLVVPHLGTAVENIESVLTTIQGFLATFLGTGELLGNQGLAYLFFVLTLLWYLIGERRARGSRNKRRIRSHKDGISISVIMGIFAALLVVGATGAMAIPAGTQEYGIVSADFDSERSDVIPTGESKSYRYVLFNDGVLPIVSVLETKGPSMEVDPRETAVPPGSVVNASVTLHAPSESGYYRRYVTEHRYLAVLPQSVIRALYEVHPWVPIVVIDAVIAVPFYVVGVRLVGDGRVRKRSRESPESVFVRVRAWLTGLY